MPTNRALRAELLRKKGWSKHNLSDRVQVKKKKSPMSTEEATYLIAHENGIKVDKYLKPEVVAQIRALVHQQAGAASASAAPRPLKRAGGKAEIREIRFPNEFKATNPLLSPSKLNEAKEMARIFPLLHVIENSMRELIKRVMHAKYGPDWWNTRLTSGRPKSVAGTAADRMKTETQRRWHQRRGSHPIDYVNLEDLGTIIKSHQTDFIPGIISDIEWFNHLMRELDPSRNVVCHMNPLDDGNITDIKSWFRKWERTIATAMSQGAIPPPPP